MANQKLKEYQKKQLRKQYRSGFTVKILAYIWRVSTMFVYKLVRDIPKPRYCVQPTKAEIELERSRTDLTDYERYMADKEKEYKEYIKRVDSM